MSAELTPSDETLASFKGRLREHLLTATASVLKSVEAAVDVLRRATDGMGTREEAIDAAASMVVAFPEMTDGSAADRVRKAVRLVRQASPERDLEALAVSIAQLSSDLMAGRPVPASRRWPIAAGLLVLAGRLPGREEAAHTREEAAHMASLGGQSEVADAITRLESLAADLPAELEHAGRALSEDGSVPDGVLADRLDELRFITVEALGGNTTTPTVAEALEALHNNEPADDSSMQSALDLAGLSGPDSAAELIERIRAVGHAATTGEAGDQERRLVEAIHAAVACTSSAELDYEALSQVDDDLRERGINPLLLVQHVGQFAVGAPPGTSTEYAASLSGTAEGESVGDRQADVQQPESPQHAEDAPEEPEADEGAGHGPEEEPPAAAPPEQGPGVGPERDAAVAAAPAAEVPVEATGPSIKQPKKAKQRKETRISGDAGASGTAAPGVPAPAPLEVPNEPNALDERVLADLVLDEPMLASLVVSAAGGARDLAAALEAIALSKALGGDDTQTAEELDGLLLEHHDRPDESDDDGALVAAAAVGLALHAPDASTLLTLNQPPAELNYLPAVGEALQGIFTGVTRGALSRRNIDSAVRQADAEKKVENILREAADMRTELPRRESRHLPAKRVWRELISDHGELGAALKAISEGHADPLAMQRTLQDWNHFDARLDRVATELGAKARIVSGVRVWLESNVHKVLDLIERWLKTTLELQASSEGGRDGAHQSLADQRRQLAELIDRALVELDEQIVTGAPLRSSCQAVLRDRLYEARAALDGDWLAPRALPPWVVRIAPAARAWGVRLDEEGRPSGERSLVLGELEVAASRQPAEAVRRQVTIGNIQAAEAALRACELEPGEADAEVLRDDIQAARRALLRELDGLARDLELHAARLLRFGIINADRHAQIAGQLEERDLSDSGRFDLRRAGLELVDAELRDGERARLKELQEKLDDTTAADEDRSRIQGLLDSGDYQIAEDFLLRLDRGETLKVVARPMLLEQFQESIAESQPDMRTLVDALARGREIPGFPLEVLSEDERGRVRDGLRALQSLEEAARQRQTRLEAAGQHLRSVGEVVGLDVVAASFKLRGRSPRGISEGTADVIPGVATWRPPVHVSPDGPRKRRTHQIVVWAGAPPAQVLESVTGHPGLPALILTATPMSAERRRQLEREARRRSVALLFVDPYTLVHCAVVSVRDGVAPLDVLVALSMALGKYNPYTAAGPVHHEMFMGRRAESAEVRDFGRAATVYGGRQLGKSALLRDIERAVNEPGDDRTPAALRACYIDLKREGVGDRLDASAIWSVIGMSLTKAGLDSLDGCRDQASVTEGIEGYLDQPLTELRLFLDEADDFLRAESETGFPNVYALRQLVEGHQDRFKVVFAGLHSVNRFRRIPNQPLAQLGVPVRIGPLTWDEGRELVLTPLEALGYRFADEALVDSILVETRRHPNLIQFACKRLVDHVAARAEQAGESAPLMITQDDLAEVFERDTEFREWLRERFELTLNLYRHYKVLALIIAMEAHADDRVRLEGLALGELEKLAREWWPGGFANMTPDEFTVVVEEMENLEVLAVNKETGQYRLPSVNLIRLLGGSEEIERHLIAEIERPPEAEEEGAQHDRRPLDRRSSSVTYDDERRILGAEANQISLVLGNEALGIDETVADLEAAVSSPEWDRQVLVRTVNVGDAMPALDPNAVLIAEVRPTPRQMTEVEGWLDELAGSDFSGNQRVILVFNGDWMPRWLTLLDYADIAPGGQVQTVVLKRWNPGAFRRLLEDMGATAERADQWLVTTGGYQVAVRQLNADLVAEADPEDWTRFAGVLAESSGLDRLPHVAAVLRELVDLGNASALDLKDLVGITIVEADDACRMLGMLGLVRFEHDGYTVNDRVPAAEISALT